MAWLLKSEICWLIAFNGIFQNAADLEAHWRRLFVMFIVNIQTVRLGGAAVEDK